MNGQYPRPGDPPLYGLIKFLALIGLITIFGLGIAIGFYLSAGIL